MCTNELNVNTTKRADQLQFLRFLAFLAIFQQHTARWQIIPRSLALGMEALSFFFVLSGVVSGYTAYGKDIQVSFKSVLGSVLKKIKKIYPLYLFTTIFSILTTWIPNSIANLEYSQMKADFIQLIKNLLFIQSWFANGKLSYNGVTWFLSILMFLCLFTSPFLHLLNRISKLKHKYPVYILLFITINLLFILYYIGIHKNNPQYWIYSFPPSRLAEYLGGVLIGYVVRSLLVEHESCFNNTILFSFLEIIAFVLWGVAAKIDAPEWIHYVILWLIPNFYGVTVFCFGKGMLSRLFRNRFLVYLGDITLECYLVHQIIITIYAELFDIAHISLIGDAFSTFFCFFCTLFLAYLLHGKPLKSIWKKT